MSSLRGLEYRHFYRTSQLLHTTALLSTSAVSLLNEQCSSFLTPGLGLTAIQIQSSLSEMEKKNSRSQRSGNNQASTPGPVFNMYGCSVVEDPPSRSGGHASSSKEDNVPSTGHAFFDGDVEPAKKESAPPSMGWGYFEADEEPAPRTPERHRGWNSSGNRWTDLGDGAAPGGSFRYDNYGRDGGYFYRNRDGSSYHKNGQTGKGTYNPPRNDGW